MASTMKSARLTTYGSSPTYTTVPSLPPPSPTQLNLKVLATGLHNVVRSRASGTHYSSAPLPATPGIDGIGEDTSSGKKYYFSTFNPGAGGSMSEYVNVEKRAVVPLPEGADVVTTAALVNPALSSWMAITTRAANLPAKFTVLILGATSASGRLAIALSRFLGAGRVIGAARNAEALAGLPLDESIVVNDADVTATDCSAVGDVDLILDYVYGPLTAHLLSSLTSTRPVQYVHIGGLSGQELLLPGAVLRSKNLTIRGSGPGAWRLTDAVEVLPQLLEALKGVGKQGDVNVVPLSEVESEWVKPKGGERIVFVP